MGTFTFMISACAHAGDTEQALQIWRDEIGDAIDRYDIYLISSLVDCLSRSGELKKAHDFIQEFEDQRHDSNIRNEVMYNSLMAGCKKYGNELMAQQVSTEYKLRFGDSSKDISSNTVALSNVFGADNKYDKVNKFRDEMNLRGMSKV